MKPTLKKIAELSGVSRGTVDRALNGRPGVKPEVKANILRIAEELNYVPNLAAKALAYNKKPITVGIIMPPKEIIFFEEIRCGINKAGEEIKDMGVKLEFKYVSNREPFEAAAAIEELVDAGVSGLLFSVMDDDLIKGKINEAANCGVPVVTFNSDVTNCKRLCFVGQDLYNSGRIAAGLFARITLTKANIVVVTGNMSFQAHRARVDGFVQRISETGSRLDIVHIIEGYDKYEETYENLLDTLSRYPETGGIYMATGHVGACVDAVKKSGLEHRVHIICNDLLPEVIESIKSGIIDFTIVQDPFMQGYKSLNILYNYIFSGRKPENEYIYTDTSIKIMENIM